jgi:hypothetical protein
MSYSAITMSAASSGAGASLHTSMRELVGLSAGTRPGTDWLLFSRDNNYAHQFRRLIFREKTINSGLACCLNGWDVACCAYISKLMALVTSNQTISL